MSASRGVSSGLPSVDLDTPSVQQKIGTSEPLPAEVGGTSYMCRGLPSGTRLQKSMEHHHFPFKKHYKWPFSRHWMDFWYIKLIWTVASYIVFLIGAA